MKCIWRIILGVLTAGLSELLRHKGHDKSKLCPDFSYKNFDIIACSHLSLGDKILYKGEVLTLDYIDYEANTCTFTGDSVKELVLNSAVHVLRINE